MYKQWEYDVINCHIHLCSCCLHHNFCTNLFLLSQACRHTHTHTHTMIDPLFSFWSWMPLLIDWPTKVKVHTKHMHTSSKWRTPTNYTAPVPLWCPSHVNLKGNFPKHAEGTATKEAIEASTSYYTVQWGVAQLVN